MIQHSLAVILRARLQFDKVNVRSQAAGPAPSLFGDFVVVAYKAFSRFLRVHGPRWRLPNSGPLAHEHGASYEHSSKVTPTQRRFGKIPPRWPKS